MGARIVLIEESPDLCRLFEYLLRVDGHTVVSFNSWRVADTALFAAAPDLIVFDWAFEDADGYAWAEAVRDASETAHIPMLFVCVSGMPRATHELLGNAGIAMIEKPFDIFAFRNRLVVLLSGRERAVGSLEQDGP